ncbi:hypothetical protein D3C87_2103270 [compost metagenome]
MLGLAEIEGERVEKLVGAQPDIAVRPHRQIGLEHVLIGVAHLGIEAVRGDDQIGVREVQIA